ncbi:DUF3578 domain-containing protein [Fructilactobacillus cliffordii]|uniref:MrcB family domain-containing protein n=1 Tax=Fructilactobacillus cliffordii TaxID=2940299 RepID=UPI0020936D31|nr:DUF3578 domain-containing protein [Fructilactobacillus cliffordii]USS86294.1 DUF3578 domain-containing protein [Fructilactobacillus cliffordii]
MDLKTYLLEILKNYDNEKNKEFKSNELANFVRNQVVNTIPSIILGNDLEVRASCGQSKWALVPWMGLFNKNISTSAQKGYYIVFLFRSDMKGVYLSLNQGYTFFKTRFKHNFPKQKIKEVGNYWKSNLKFIKKEDTFGFTTNPINLIGDSIVKTDLPEGYELGNIYSKYYSFDYLSNSDNNELLYDLKHIIEVFNELIACLINEKDFVKTNDQIINNDKYNESNHELINNKYSDEMTLGIETKIPNDQKLKKIDHVVKISKHDYVKELSENIKLGLETEDLVVANEKERLDKDPNVYDFGVHHISKDCGDGYGYDIETIIFNDRGEIIKRLFIEVKATAETKETPFFMSKNEIQIAKKKGEDYLIYRLYRNEAETAKFNFYIIRNPYRYLNFKPINYIVYPKK